MSRNLDDADETLALALLANSQAELAALARRLDAVLEVCAQDLEHLHSAEAYAALVLLAHSQAKLRALADRLEGLLAVWARDLESAA